MFLCVLPVVAETTARLVLILLPAAARRGKSMKVALVFFLMSVALSLFAQSDAAPETRAIRSAAELQYYNFDNFFQATEGMPERNVSAFGAAYRASWSLGNDAPDLYGRLSALRYSGGASETSYTGQAGVSKYGSVHWYDVYLERTENGYAFDIDETRASASITALSGHYSYAINPDWRVGTDLYLDWTRFNVDAGLENDYQSVGLDLRYRGFGDRIQPRIGYVSGQRDSRDRTDSAADRYWFAELRSKPHPSVDLRLRYRDRTRDYDNISRVDDRAQWTLRAAFRQNERLSWSGSLSTEEVDSSLAGRDFKRRTANVTLIYGF